MTNRPPAQHVLELADRLLVGNLDAAALEGLKGSLAALDPAARELAERVLQLSRERREFRKGLVQTAKLAEVGLAFAELVHELRQPLSSIAGFAQLLGSPASPREVSDGIGEILTQCSRMEAMLEQLRRFLRPDDELVGGPRPVDLAEALRAAVSVTPKMPPGVTLQVQLADELGKVMGEKEPLVQVVFNLLANARDAQASKGPGAILLKADREGDVATLVVADEGVGVPAEFLDRLFEPFATSKGEAGTGLGLYICQEILATWDAEITLLSPPPKPYVTAFAVRLRGTGQKEQGTPATLDSLRAELARLLGEAGPSRRVLVVDDEPAVRRLLKVLLSAEPGLQIADAGSGVEALALLEKEPVQVLVTDKNLPGMTGLQLAQRALQEGKAAEAVLVTGFPSPESVVEALDAGACAFLVKPVEDATLLRSCVRSALEREQLRRRVGSLGVQLRPWADRALHAARGTGASRLFVDALEILAQRPEGPGKVGIVAERALVAPLALAGQRTEGPWGLPRALTAATAGEVEALVIGEGVRADEARDLIRMVQDSPWAPALVWALPAGSFEEALVLLEARVAAVLPRPVDPAALSAAVTRAIEARRREVRARALGVVLAELKLGQAAAA